MRERMLALVRWSPWILLAVFLGWYLRTELLDEVQAIIQLAEVDRVAGRRRYAHLMTIMAAIGGMIGLGMLGFMIWTLRRTVRERRWPLAGAAVSRRTLVISGWCLRVRVGFMVTATFAMGGMVVVSAWQLAEWSSTLVSEHPMQFPM